NDDLPYIFANASEDNFMIGSDYGHSDTSSELEALKSLKSSGLLEPRVVDKVLSDNPARLYGIE
ncbi:MAG: amidohydrolase family protein, partial [Chloroflexi bacterium]|nr:amidohydrolase family protein [Chloroflexota bacterium]